MADRINMPAGGSSPVSTSDTSPSLTSLVGGIVDDLQRLIRQELQLAKTEVQQEWEKAKTAAASMAAGTALLGLAAVLICFMFVYLLAAYVTAIPLWGWFGIVGGLLAIAGGLLIATGRAKATEIHAVPPQTAETLKENVQWMKNQR
jgi:protein-S-isoprenylcysteine O-methyltransferase Ste14